MRIVSQRTALIWIAGVLASCTVSAPRANPLDPFFPTPMSPAEEPEHSGEQAEVATVVSQTPQGQEVVLAGYRYTGPHKFPETPTDDFTYSTDGSNGVVVRDGASIAGFSYSLDGGVTWQVPTVGKIYPSFVDGCGLPNCTFGDPVAVLWGDPALMAGFKKHNLVAYATLAVSREAFDAAKIGISPCGGNDGALHCFPSGQPDLIDSACVAFSNDGGRAFTSLFCKRPNDIGATGSDQTTVGIDKNDQIFLAFDDYAHEKIDLYQIFTLASEGGFQVVFNQLAIDPQMQTASHSPRIVRDQAGELWLAASKLSPNDVRLCHRPAPRMFGSGGCDFVGQITTRAEPIPALLNSNVGPIRTGVTVSFAANRVTPTVPQVLPHTDFYFAYHRRDGMKVLHTGATACRLWVVANNPFTCKDVEAWGTFSMDGSSQQFQPAMELVASQDGSYVDAQYAYYQVDASDIVAGHARVRRAVLRGSPFGGPPSTARFEDLPLARDPAVCAAKGYASGTRFYWGDFFGFRFVPPPPGSLLPPRHLVVYSSDDREGCPPPLQTNIFQGRHLHVVSWSWPD